MVQVLKTVFSNFKYLLLAIGIFISMLIGLLILSEYIFIEPYLTGHIPKGTELGFSLIVILSGMSALVLPMNVYRINILKRNSCKLERDRSQLGQPQLCS